MSHIVSARLDLNRRHAHSYRGKIISNPLSVRIIGIKVVAFRVTFPLYPIDRRGECKR